MLHVPCSMIKVSVIITTKNEEKNIENCLKSIASQSYPNDNIEIIVVDNSSTDKTKEIARKFTDKVFDKGPERSAQRNFGVEKSIGEYFLQLDADQILKSDVIKKCVNMVLSFRKRKSGKFADIALQIPEIITGKKLFTKIRLFEKQFYTGTVIDCVRFMPVKVFRDIGGFDLSMTGAEDWDLDKRIRNRCFIDVVDSYMEHNEGDITLLKFLKKKWYYSASFHKYFLKWGKKDPDTKKRFGFYYRYFGVFFEKNKWREVLKHPLLFSLLFMTKILVGLVLFLRLLKRNE